MGQGGTVPQMQTYVPIFATMGVESRDAIAQSLIRIAIEYQRIIAIQFQYTETFRIDIYVFRYRQEMQLICVIQVAINDPNNINDAEDGGQWFCHVDRFAFDI